MVLFSEVRPFYFVTFNIADRRPVLVNEAVHGAFVRYIEIGESHGVAVGRYVIMPDHVHVFVCMPLAGVTLTNWVKGLKRALSVPLKTDNVPSPHWQEGFFDHVLRNTESYGEKWNYVRENPVRKGLCASADDWPWQGEPHILRF